MFNSFFRIAVETCLIARSYEHVLAKHIFSAQPQSTLTNLAPGHKSALEKFTEIKKIKLLELKTTKKITKVHIKCFFFQVFAACVYFPTTEKICKT